MKVILEFDLDEKQAAIRAQKADKAYYVLSELDRYLRSKLKYEELTAQQAMTYQEVRDFLTQAIQDAGINMDEEWV